MRCRCSYASVPAILSPSIQCIEPEWVSTSILDDVPLICINAASILFCVSVPVLSVTITLVPPKVSTADNFFTITLYFAMRSIPNARAKVATMGKPSGIAATASAMDVSSICTIFCPFKMPAKKMIIRRPTVIQINFLLKC